jgi:hypothetical protein
MENKPTLRALGIGEMLDRAFGLYRSQFLTLVGIVALPLIPATVLNIFGLILMSEESASVIAIVLQFIVLFVSSFVQLLIATALLIAISRAYISRAVPIGEAFRRGLGRCGPLFGASLLLGILVVIPAMVVGFCLMAIGEFGIFLFVILVMPAAIYFGVRLSMLAPVVVFEEESGIDAIRRSWNLTRGYFWRVFGTSVLAGLLTLVVAGLPAAILQYGFGQASTGLLATVVSTLVGQLSTVITMPFSQAVTVLIYYDLRVRQEGYDLELQAESVLEASEYV